MRSPAVPVLLLVTCYLLLAVACGGDNGGGGGAPTGAHRVATFNERCPRCGMQWSVKVDEYTSGADRLEIVIENTGERGVLQLQSQPMVALVLDQLQAGAWRVAYPSARAERDALQRLIATNGGKAVPIRPSAGTTLPFTLRPGGNWTGRFDAEIPADTAGLILAFGPVEHEITPPDLRPLDYWITWDLSRPYIGLDGEVRVTPVATPR